MSHYGKINLAGMLALPLVALVGSVILFGVLPDTQLFVFGSNAVPMLIGGLVSGLLLRSANKWHRGHRLALMPTLVPAAAGVSWYLYGGLMFTGDAGREYFAGPFYLLAGVVVTAIIAWVACRASRASGATSRA